MNVNELYSSESSWLKAEHLPAGKEIPVTISETEVTELDNKKKLVLKFVGKEKGLVLNKTNAMTIEHVYGPESMSWIGKNILLFTTKVDYAGQMVDAIRVRVQLQSAQDDEIPGF